MTVQYKQTLQYVRDNGVMRGDRTGKGRHSVFSPPDEIYNLQEGFPLSTLREVSPGATVDELLWFISGSTALKDLKTSFFWKRWVPTAEHAEAYAKILGLNGVEDLTPEQLARVGTIGHLYGVSWRNAPGPVGENLPVRKAADMPRSLIEKFVFNGPDDKPVLSVDDLIKYLDDTTEGEDTLTVTEFKATLRGAVHKAYWENYDQLNELVLKIKSTPYSSRLRVSAYLTQYMAFEEFTPQENTMDGRACLTPCHTFFQCYVNSPTQEGGKGKLDLKLMLTSSDVPVGRVYNIAQYAILTHMLAQVCDLDVGRLIISTGDAHIYGDQFEAVEEILSREPLPLSTLHLNPEIKDIFSFKKEDIQIKEYQSHPKVAVPIAV